MQAPRGGPFLGKRKEREYYYPSLSSSEQATVPLARPPPFARPDPHDKPNRPAARLGAKPPLAPTPRAASQGGGGNKLLAGYLVHEFLTYGTLLGERRLEPPPRRKETEPLAVALPEPGRRYAEVSRLIMVGWAASPASSTRRSSAAGSGSRSSVRPPEAAGGRAAGATFAALRLTGRARARGGNRSTPKNHRCSGGVWT